MKEFYLKRLKLLLWHYNKWNNGRIHLNHLMIHYWQLQTLIIFLSSWKALARTSGLIGGLDPKTGSLGLSGYGSSWFNGSSSEIPWNRRKSSQNLWKTCPRGSGFMGHGSLGHGLHGFRTHMGHGLTRDRIAGVLWSRRRHPPEDRAPSPSTLSVSSPYLDLTLCSQLPL
jgi:hypothetical protein